jgi:hypothetical protein
MPNDINSISPTIRDFLLNRNLILSDTVTDNGLSSVAIGLGSQTPLETLPEAVRASENIEITSETQREELLLKNPYGSTDDLVLTNITNNPGTGNLEPGTPSVEYGKYVGSQTENSLFNNTNTEVRDRVTLKNQYISAEQMVNATVINNSFAYKQIDGGYLDENGHLNIGGPSTEPHDAIGALLSGDGFGLDAKGLVSQFNIRSSLAGRVLGATGAINDTPLGIIGGQQLLLALGQKDIFNAQKAIRENLNTNVLSLLKGDGLFKDNYSITVRPTLGGKILDQALDLSGFEIPQSTIKPGASIFQDDGGFVSNSVLRNINLIKNTGKGQYRRLFELLNANQSYSDEDGNPIFRYKPAYDTGSIKDKLGVEDPVVYTVTPDSLTDIRDNRTELDERKEGNIWEIPLTPSKDDYSLLSKTKRLFNTRTGLVGALFNAQGTEHLDILGTSQLETPSGGRLPRGSGVLSQDALDGKGGDNVFCRTWTTTNRYDRVSSLQKKTGLIKYRDRIRNNTQDSVLGENGFVKISPYHKGGVNVDEGDVKRYMFSIENLAWNDSLVNLPRIETGPGDLTTGTKGRIMWFPPYGMKFTDTTSVDWDSTKFIGRGEPVYTYNNTERSGTLDFQVIIDYPDYMNNTKINTKDILASLAAGCSDYDSLFSTSERNAVENEIVPKAKIRKSRVSQSSDLPDLKIYFDNGLSAVDEDYEDAGTTELQQDGEYGLNRPWTDSPNTLTLKLNLNGSYKAHRMTITGHASKDGTSANNQTLSEARATNVKQWILDNLDDKSDKYFHKRITVLPSRGDNDAIADAGNPDSKTTKEDRVVVVKFKYDAALDKQVIDSANAKTEPSKESGEFVTKIKKRFHNEGNYFKELSNSGDNNDKIIFDNIKDKIGFFQPAFHSITPEGFNSRLTFLQQCTRQGPTNRNLGASNLAFGMPPVCILRIGDFYHTKIIIENLSLDYEPLVWDLNPEGVGVQPMIANVSLSFKFIGGSSLKGPINKLQNAVSFNYFANTEVYDPRADSLIAKTPEEVENENVSPGEYKIEPGTYHMELEEIQENAEIQGLDLKPSEVDQTLATEVEATKTIASTVSGASNVTGFWFISTERIDETHVAIQVQVRTEYIDPGDPDILFDTLAGRGVKVSLQTVGYFTPETITEELMGTDSTDTTGKSFKSGVDVAGSGWYFGTLIPSINGDPVLTGIENGTYNLSLRYDGKNLGMKLITVQESGTWSASY